MVKNDVITISITGMTSDGAGVGRHDGTAVFVRGAAVGDTLEAVVIKVTKNYAVGKILRIITPSDVRQSIDCPAYPRCGGCVYRHISYEEELRIKRERVADCIKRIGGLDVPVGECGHGGEYGYRNKAQYPVGKSGDGLSIGFYAPHSHRIIDCRECALQPPEFSDILRVTEDYVQKGNISVYNEETHSGLLRHIYVRKAEATDQIMVCLVINGDTLPHAEKFVDAVKELLGDRLKTVVLNINTADTNVILSDKCKTIYGDGYITDILCGIKIRLSALSFYQVNRAMAARLYEKAAQLAGGGRLLLDLYCGAGAIGLSMADKFESVIGVEIIPEAVEDAKHNAKINGIGNARFICADAYSAAQQLKNEGITPDTVIVDPPRKGLENGLPQLIADSFSPQRIVYISCDPATLARDLAEFHKCGYIAQSATPFDLFPRTAHVETVALLSRK